MRIEYQVCFVFVYVLFLNVANLVLHVLIGTVPSEICNLKSISFLDLHNNRIEGRHIEFKFETILSILHRMVNFFCLW